MQHGQHPQMSVRHWRRALPLPLHCGYEIESRRDSQIFHRQNHTGNFPEMSNGQFEAMQMAHHILNTQFNSRNSYTKGMEIIFTSTTRNQLISVTRILFKKETQNRTFVLFRLKRSFYYRLIYCYWFSSIFFMWRYGPMRAMASSFLRFLDHTQ